MATPFNLTAQINLRGPTNTRAIASQIRKQLSGLDVKVDVSLKGSASKNINAINKQLKQLNVNAAAARKNMASLGASTSKVGASLGSMGSQGAASLAQTSKQANSAGKSLQMASSQIEEFGKQSGLAIRRFAAFSAVTGVVYAFTNAINSAFKEFVQFDRQLVRLSQVTGTSIAGLSGITNEITKLSTNLGVASSDLMQVSVTLAQAGLTATETKTALEALAKSALAPSFDNLNQTVEGSIALMKQFSLSSGELEGALGSINAVAASFAVEAGDIIKAIQRTGGVFASASAGVAEGSEALNQFIAVFTSVRSTTRESAETIATGLRTIFTRIQRGSTIEALKEFGITLTDLEGKFVGPFEAIRRLSEGLSGLDPRDLRFNEIVEQLGGFRQIGKVIPLLQQFSTAQKALAVAQGGQDSLAKNAAQAQASLAVQFEKTRQSFVALVRDIGNSATFKTIATVTLTTANAFITLAGALKPLLPMLTALAAFKGASVLSEFGGGFLGGMGKGGGGKGFATGGMVPGSGSGDTVPARLTPGEFVIRKKAVKSFGANNLAKINKYASGGKVAQIMATDAYDGDSWHTQHHPESTAIVKGTSRADGYDAYELRGGQKWEKALGKKAAAMAQAGFTDSTYMGNDHSLFGALKQEESVGGRPVHSVPDSLVNNMVSAGVAIRTQRGGEVATGGKRSEAVKQAQIETLMAMGKPQLAQSRKRSKFAMGGSVASSDTVPAMVTPGEFVVNKKSAQAFGYGNLKKINGYAQGGVVGGIQHFVNGGTVKEDQANYLSSMADKLGTTVAKLEVQIRSTIMRNAEVASANKTRAKGNIASTITSKSRTIGDAGVADAVRQNLGKLISKIDPSMAEKELAATVDEVVQGMKDGLSIDEIADSSDKFKKVIDRDISALAELGNAQEKMADKVGFLNSKMKVRGIDIRARRSQEAGKFGALDQGNLRRAQLSIESGIGKKLDRFGEANSVANIPGMGALSKRFPDLANKVTAVGNKMGGIAGVLGAGSSLIGAKMDGLGESFDELTGSSLSLSPAFAGLGGAMRQGGSMGISGAIAGQQAFGKRGGAIGGAAGMAAGAVTGFIDASIAKESAEAFKDVTAASAELQKQLNRQASAATPQERQAAEKESLIGYGRLNQAINKTGKTIDGNKIWGLFSGALGGAAQAVLTFASVMAMASMSTAMSSMGGGMPKKAALGGRIGLAKGGSPRQRGRGQLVPVKLAAGEGVLTPPVPVSNGEFSMMNNAHINGFKPNPKLAGQMGIVPGSGNGRTDSFNTELPVGSMVIQRRAMDAMYAASGGSIGARGVSRKGYAVGGSIFSTGASVPRPQHANPGAIILAALPQLIVAVGAIVGMVGGFMSYLKINAELEKQKLAAEIQTLEELRKLVATQSSQDVMTNMPFSQRMFSASEAVERSDMTDEEKRTAYATDPNLDFMGEMNKRGALVAMGFDIPDEASVDQFLAALKTEDIDAYNKAIAETKRAQEQLNKRIYLEKRVREGLDIKEAEREFDRRKNEEPDALQDDINQEKGRENRSKGLADRMKILNEALRDYTLSINDLYTRTAASFERAVVDLQRFGNRAIQSSNLTTSRSTALDPNTFAADVMSNTTAYSDDTVRDVTNNIATGMGGGEEAQNAAGMVQGLNRLEKELPAVLRAASNADLSEGQDQVLDELLTDMFSDMNIGDGLKKELIKQVIDSVDDKTGGRQSKSLEDLADKGLAGLEGLSNSAKKARELLTQYAKAQVAAVNVLNNMVNQLVQNNMRLAQLSTKAMNIMAEGSIRLDRQLKKDISLEQLNEPFINSINNLTDQGMNPADIRRQIQADASRLKDISNTPEDQKDSIMDGEQEAPLTRLAKNKKALDDLANSTSMADNALEKLAEQQRMSEARVQQTMGFLDMVGDPEAMMGFVQNNDSLDRVMNFDNPDPAKRRDVGIVDIKRGLQALNAQKGTMTEEDFQKKRKKFIENSIAMLIQAGTITKEQGEALAVSMKGDLGDPMENEAFKPFIKAYEEALQLQTDAVNAQIELQTQANVELTGNIIQAGENFNKLVIDAMANNAASLEEAGAKFVQAGDDFASIVNGAGNDFREQAEAAAAASAADPNNRPLNDGQNGEGNAIPSEPPGGWPQGVDPYWRERQEQQNMNSGGVVYASGGKLINFQSRGTDTVPAMLTPGEFVVRKTATQKNLPLLRSLNSGSNVVNSNGVGYADRGGLFGRRGVTQQLPEMVHRPGLTERFNSLFNNNSRGSRSRGSGGSPSVDMRGFNNFIQDLNRETSNFGNLIDNLARVFPALTGPINNFGGFVENFSRSIDRLENIEIKGPNIPNSIRINSETIRVELVAPQDINYKLTEEDKRAITSSLENRLQQLTVLGR